LTCASGEDMGNPRIQAKESEVYAGLFKDQEIMAREVAHGIASTGQDLGDVLETLFMIKVKTKGDFDQALQCMHSVLKENSEMVGMCANQINSLYTDVSADEAANITRELRGYCTQDNVSGGVRDSLRSRNHYGFGRRDGGVSRGKMHSAPNGAVRDYDGGRSVKVNGARPKND